MLARIPLIPVVLVAISVSVVLAVLMLLGAPMAGGWSSVAALVISGMLTVLMALAFSHREHVDPGR